MKKDSAELDFNVFVGAETGILKGVNVNQKATISKNFHNLSNLQKDFEITCMSFGESENEILLGLRNQTVKERRGGGVVNICCSRAAQAAWWG